MRSRAADSQVMALGPTISNLPEWNGQTNPVSDTRKLYAIASDGWRNPNPMLAGTGITTQLKPIGCNADASVGCGAAVPVDHY